MSTEAVSAFIAHSRSYGSVRLVGTVLAHHIGADPREACWPSHALLAEETGYSVRHIIRCIDELVALGEFEVFTANDLNAKTKLPNHYYIKIECPDDCDGSNSHRKLPEWRRMEARKVIHMGDIYDTHG